MLKSYIIIDFSGSIEENLKDFESFEDFLCIGYCKNLDTSLNTILEKRPQLIFFHFSEEIPLSLLFELSQYLDNLPYIIAINTEERFAYQALKHGASDYLLYPLQKSELRKSLLKFSKSYRSIENNKLCIRSNGDYHFISFEEIIYLKADNNTTDFYLQNGNVIPGFKTMKFFENQLPFYFFRIHNSFIVNIHYITRINIGKSNCYLLDNNIKIPFSRTYKNQIDIILKQIG